MLQVVIPMAGKAARFQEQVRRKEAGDAEAMYYDADYIHALEHGMPPCAGGGPGPLALHQVPSNLGVGGHDRDGASHLG